MSLRKRLLLLLGIFAIYAVVAAGVTVYGNHWRIEASLKRFEQAVGQTLQMDRLHLLLTEQMFHLTDLVEGQTSALSSYSSARDVFFTSLRQATSFAPDGSNGQDWEEILRLAESFEIESNRCLTHAEAQARQEARDILTTRLEAKIVPELRALLVKAKTQLTTVRNMSARELDTASSRILTLTIAVGILAAVLVIVGALMIHRWLMAPLRVIHKATRRYSDGDLSFRTSVMRRDELGELGGALNEMAQRVAASEQKHRTLFSNLRDAVVICENDGRIVEYHDGDTHLLSVDEGQHIGRYVLDVWPEWGAAVKTFPTIIQQAIADGRRHEAANVPLSTAGHESNDTYVDFIVYRVEYGEERYAAVVIRDATERNRLQRRVRRAETMEAVGTMAGGLAHDVSNLLSSVVGTLSALGSDLAGSKHAERIQAALKTCRRAAGLSKRLLNFARGAHGTQQVFAPGNIADTVLDSLEPESLRDIELERDLDRSVLIHMDQDQFAQILLNLLRNAQDAMAEGGKLRVWLRTTRTRNPDTSEPERLYVCLEIRDSGVGMSPDVEQRVFEPFFSTKPRTDQHGRGMGMAIVHSAVTNAGGFVLIESEAAVGTTVQVFIPVASSANAEGQFSGTSVAPTE
ncbi:MAG: HAMP domain-containing protein [Phycisphaerales bacterium]|nr:MAG: HAMP domain-containing protein [Phycisphaerales bacterium]